MKIIRSFHPSAEHKYKSIIPELTKSVDILRLML